MQNFTIPAPQPPSRSTQYHIINYTTSHQTQGYCQTPTHLLLSNSIMSANIGAWCFRAAVQEWWNWDIFGQWNLAGGWWWIVGRYKPVRHRDDRRSEDHNISDNLSYWPSNEEPTEAIVEGVNMHSKPASQILKISSLVPSPKILFHAEKCNFHLIPS